MEKINKTKQAEKVYGWNRGEVIKEGDRYIILHEDTKEIIKEVSLKDETRSFFDGYGKGWEERGRRNLLIKKAKYLLVKDEFGKILLRTDRRRIAESFIDGYKIGGERKIDFWHKVK